MVIRNKRVDKFNRSPVLSTTRTLAINLLTSVNFQGLGQTATNIVQVAKDEHEQKGVTGAVGGVLRQVPATMVQPLILATEATSNVLGGVRNQILPDARREAAEKWRSTP